MGRNGIICVAFIMFICCVLLVVFGFTIVSPYRITSSFSETNCKALNVTFHGYSECSCGHGDDNCTSIFPCQEITVTFSTTELPQPHEAMLFQNYDPEYETETCSIWTCDESPDINKQRVSEFVASYGNTDGNSTYTCFYNPENPDEVIIEKTSQTAVILSMVLPSIVFLICVIVLLVLCCRQSGGDYSAMFRTSGNNFAV